MSDRIQQLERLSTLLERGVLTKAEFDSEKARLLSLPELAPNKTVSGSGVVKVSVDNLSVGTDSHLSPELSRPEPKEPHSSERATEDAPSASVTSSGGKMARIIGLLVVLLAVVAAFVTKQKFDAEAAADASSVQAAAADRERQQAVTERERAEAERRAAEDERRAAEERARLAALPSFRALNMTMDDSCTTFGDYCLTVTCLVENTGGTAGTAQVEFNMTSGSGGEVRATGSGLVASGAVAKITYKFREARMSETARGNCRILN